MTSVANIRRAFAQQLLDENRMIVEPTADMLRRFPLGVAGGDAAVWLKAVKKLLGDAVELRQPLTPSGEWKLAVKDRGVLFTQANADVMEAMAQRRKAGQDA